MKETAEYLNHTDNSCVDMYMIVSKNGAIFRYEFFTDGVNKAICLYDEDAATIMFEKGSIWNDNKLIKLDDDFNKHHFPCFPFQVLLYHYVSDCVALGDTKVDGKHCVAYAVKTTGLDKTLPAYIIAFYDNVQLVYRRFILIYGRGKHFITRKFF